MSAVQLASARIGRVTGCGLASNLLKVMPRWAVLLLVTLLFIANVINIGADLAAMGDAAELVVGTGGHAFTALFAISSLLLQIFVPYRKYASFLKWLTLVLLTYVALVFMVKVDWRAAGMGLVVPTLSGTAVITTVVAIFDTTISPFLFFWQASQEVEEIGLDDEREPLADQPKQSKDALRRIRYDTFAGMAVSNLVGLAIMLGTAATLHASGKTDIQTAADAAKALQPVAGSLAFALFSLGIVGTGMLAVPVLSGSAAFAIGETMGWNTGLEEKPRGAKAFYAVITVAMLLGIGIGIDWSPIEPIKALFWSAVVNGVAAVPILAGTMLVASRRPIMGELAAPRIMLLLGWTTAVVMGVAAIAMAVLPA